MIPWKEKFAAEGFVLLENQIDPAELREIKPIVLGAHDNWVKDNAELYARRAINSAYLTSSKYCRDAEGRAKFFRFLAGTRVAGPAAACLEKPYFRNTQLFFNPSDPDQKPYWHRDIQYSGLSEAEQKEGILTDDNLHFRIPLEEDPGLDFVPGSHLRWDTDEERAVRLELLGRKCHESLPGSVRIPHKPGDLLIFSAHLLHKGVYGGNRLSLDILFGDKPEKREMVARLDHFPGEASRVEFSNPEIFTVTD